MVRDNDVEIGYDLARDSQTYDVTASGIVVVSASSKAALVEV